MCRSGRIWRLGASGVVGDLTRIACSISQISTRHSELAAQPSKSGFLIRLWPHERVGHAYVVKVGRETRLWTVMHARDPPHQHLRSVPPLPSAVPPSRPPAHAPAEPPEPNRRANRAKSQNQAASEPAGRRANRRANQPAGEPTRQRTNPPANQPSSERGRLAPRPLAGLLGPHRGSRFVEVTLPRRRPPRRRPPAHPLLLVHPLIRHTQRPGGRPCLRWDVDGAV